MKAKLVYCSFVTRVVVADNATEDQIIQESKDQFIQKVRDDLGENIEEIIEDEECPYNPETDK